MIDLSETDTAIDSAGKFLKETGFGWFDDPYRLTPTQWATTKNILIRDWTFVSPTLLLPQSRDPKSMVRIRKSLPQFEHVSLVKLKGQLDGFDKYELKRTPLANALELQQTAAKQQMELRLTKHDIAE